MKLLSNNIFVFLILTLSTIKPVFAQVMDKASSGSSFEIINQPDRTKIRPVIEPTDKYASSQARLDSLYNVLKKCKEERKNDSVALLLFNMGLIYGENDKNKEAIVCLKQSIDIFEDVNNNNLLRQKLSETGNLFDQASYGITGANDKTAKPSQEELRKGITYLNSGLSKYKKLGRYEDIAAIHEVLSNAYHFAGNDDLALEAVRQSAVYKDSIHAKQNAETQAIIQETTEQLRLKQLAIEVNEKNAQLSALKYEYEKKQAAAKSEKEKQQLKYEEEARIRQINFDFEKKQEAQKRASLLIKAEQERNIEAAKLQLEKKNILLYSGLAALLLLLGFAVYIIRNNRLLSIEKHKSESLLLNILPSEVADELKERGATTAKYFDSVTVLFTDFVAFTKAGERMGSQKLVEELHTCFKAFDEITSRYHIEKIKTIGDAYLAVCGLPLSDAQHAEHVVKAAIEILAFMNNRRKELGDQTFEIRIGINSGSLVAGIVGVKKFAYDIWGDTVNTAARMEQNSLPGKINVSETTFELIKDKFACTYRGEIEAKNKGMLKMYFVES